MEVSGKVDSDVLIVGWGSTWGAITHAMARLKNAGHQVAHVHLRHLNPFPANLGEVLGRYSTIVVPELNSGQLSRLLRAEFLVDAHSISKVAGQPFSAAELTARISEVLR